MSQLTRISSSLKMGIVGMANVGKSSTFNMLSKQSVSAENFPFCTIDPNQAVVKVPDPRLIIYVRFSNLNLKSSLLQVLQILQVKGASEGYGLGNEFLAHIQAVDGLYQVVRAFEKEKSVHTEDTIDPIRDLQIISAELMAKDISICVQKEQINLAKNQKVLSQQKCFIEVREMVEYIKSYKNVMNFQKRNNGKIQLLTAKPSIYLIHLSKEDHDAYVARKQNKYAKPIEQWVFQNSPDSKVVYSLLKIRINSNWQIKLQLLDMIYQVQLDFSLLVQMKQKLDCKENIKAPQAAYCHSFRFEKGFVNDEVMFYEKFRKLGDMPQIYMKRNFQKKEGLHCKRW